MFEEIIKKVIKHEGGYANHPDDRGGETYKGVSRVNWPDWDGWEIIDNIKKKAEDHTEFLNKLRNNKELDELVIKFYKINFWRKIKTDKFDKEIAYLLFDTAVNMGTGRAIMILQDTYNKVTPDNHISVDGIVGPQTIGAVNKADREHIIIGYISGRIQRYFDIINNNSSQKVFLRGWMNRMVRIILQIYGRNQPEKKEEGYSISQITKALERLLRAELGG